MTVIKLYVLFMIHRFGNDKNEDLVGKEFSKCVCCINAVFGNVVKHVAHVKNKRLNFI